MTSKEKKSVYVFAAALLAVLAVIGIAALNNSGSITGYQVWDEFDDTITGDTGKQKCKSSYFGDKYCDDSKADCGQYYKPGISVAACDECQTIKNGKPGFDKCVGQEVEAEKETATSTYNVTSTYNDTSTTTKSNSCINSCGQKSKTGNCYCDNACLNYGDCCSDYQSICAATIGDEWM